MSSRLRTTGQTTYVQAAAAKHSVDV